MSLNPCLVTDFPVDYSLPPLTQIGQLSVTDNSMNTLSTGQPLWQ